jgi:hypothetical protein
VKFTLRVLTLIGLVSAFGLLWACGGPSTPAAPSTPTSAAQLGGTVVIINSPASNSDFESGAQVTVKSTSTSGNGVVLVELIADGRVVQSSPTPNGQPQTQFSVLQIWQAIPGKHTLTVRATDARANTADAAIVVNVNVPGQPTAAQPTIPPPPDSCATNADSRNARSTDVYAQCQLCRRCDYSRRHDDCAK